MDAEVANELDICSRLLQEGPASALVRPSSAASARGVGSPGMGWEGESHDNVSLKSFRLDQHAEVSMPRLVAFRKSLTPLSSHELQPSNFYFRI